MTDGHGMTEWPRLHSIEWQYIASEHTSVVWSKKFFYINPVDCRRWGLRDFGPV